MTATDVSGVPGEIRAALGRAHLAQEPAFEAAGLSRGTYFRRMGSPGDWRLEELERLAAVAGCTLSVAFLPVRAEPYPGAALERERMTRPCALDDPHEPHERSNGKHCPGLVDEDEPTDAEAAPWPGLGSQP